MTPCRKACSIGFNQNVDSAFIVRVDLATRVLDTVATIRIPTAKRIVKVDAQGALLSIETTPDPLPLVDDWATMPDGSIAVLRARDYHLDWLDANGRWSSTPKDALRLAAREGDDRKQMLIDSAVKSWQATFDGIAAGSRGGGGSGAAGGSGTGGRGVAGHRDSRVDQATLHRIWRCDRHWAISLTTCLRSR